MSEYNNNGEPETVSGEVTVPEVVQTDVLATHREDVSKTIEAAFRSLTVASTTPRLLAPTVLNRCPSTSTSQPMIRGS